MKRCPKCNRTYDDLQVFCLDDGEQLLIENDSQATQVLTPPRKSKSKIAFLLIAVVMFLIGAIVITALLLLYLKGQNTTVNRERAEPVNTPTPIVNATPIATVTPIPSPTPEPSPEHSPTSNTNVNQAPTPTPTPSSENTSTQQSSVTKIEDHSVVFNLQKCRKSGTSISCDFLLTNTGQDRRFSLYTYYSRLYDELGNGYEGSSAQVANQSGRSPDIDFISGVTSKARMTFENIEQNTTRITLLQISANIGDSRVEIKFRNVPLELK